MNGSQIRCDRDASRLEKQGDLWLPPQLVARALTAVDVRYHLAQVQSLRRSVVVLVKAMPACRLIARPPPARAIQPEREFCRYGPGESAAKSTSRYFAPSHA